MYYRTENIIYTWGIRSIERTKTHFTSLIHFFWLNYKLKKNIESKITRFVNEFYATTPNNTSNRNSCDFLSDLRSNFFKSTKSNIETFFFFRRDIFVQAKWSDTNRKHCKSLEHKHEVFKTKLSVREKSNIKSIFFSLFSSSSFFSCHWTW